MNSLNPIIDLIGKIFLWGAGLFLGSLLLLFWLLISFFFLWFISGFIKKKIEDFSTWWGRWRAEAAERRRTVFREVFMDKWLKERSWAAEWAQKRK